MKNWPCGQDFFNRLRASSPRRLARPRQPRPQPGRYSLDAGERWGGMGEVDASLDGRGTVVLCNGFKRCGGFHGCVIFFAKVHVKRIGFPRFRIFFKKDKKMTCLTFQSVRESKVVAKIKNDQKT